jgi:translocation and assembly module TamA
MDNAGGPGTKRRSRRWRRVRLLLAAAFVVAAIPASILGSLRLSSVRGPVAVWVSHRLETSAGVTLRLQDFDIEPWGGVLEIRGLAVASTGAADEPLLTASLVRAELDLPALLRGRVIVRELRVERPRFVVDAPLPSLPRVQGGPPSAKGLAVEVRSLDLRGGEVGSRNESFRLSDIHGRGSFAKGRCEATVSRAQLHVAGHGRAVDLNLEGSLAVGIDGSFEVSALKARGAGIELSARGEGSLGPRLRVDASYEAQGDLALLAPDLVPRGEVALRGSVAIGGDAAGPTGTARVEAHGIAAEAAARFLPFALPPALALPGSEVDGTGDLEFDFSSARSPEGLRADAIRGAASLVWRRGTAHLLDVSLRSEAENPPTADRSGRFSVHAALFPDSEGKRRLDGIVRLRSFADPASGEILQARMDLIEPELPAMLERLGLPVPVFAAKLPPGGLEATAEAVGPLASPRLGFHAAWREGEETLATLAASSPAGWRGWASDVVLDLEASVLPLEPGSRRATARLAGLELKDGLVHVELPELGRALNDLYRRAGVTLPEGADRFDAMLAGPFDAGASFSGPATKPRISLDATWKPDGKGAIHIAASGQPKGEAPFLELAEPARLEARDVDGTPFGLSGLILHALDASSDGEHVSVENIVATLPPLAPGAAPAELSGSGGFELAWPPASGEAEITVEHPLGGIDRVVAHARLDGGVLRIDELDVDSGAARASIHGAVPLAAVAPYAGPLRETLARYTAGPITVEAEGIDLGRLQSLLPLPQGLPVASGAVSVQVTFDAEHPMSAVGTLEARDIALEIDRYRAEAAGPIRLDMRDGKVVLAPITLRAMGPDVTDGHAVEISGSLDLAQDWSAGQDVAALIRDSSFELHGTIDAAAFSRFLKLGKASGSLVVDATAGGPLRDITADVRVSGPGLRVSYLSGYATRFESPEAHLRLRGGKLEIESARARWNGGEVQVRGTVDREGAHMTVDARGVAYRLEYGTSVRIGGQLELAWPAQGDRSLRGSVIVERAAVLRNIALDREVLRAILEPSGMADNALLDTIHLDLDVTTEQGLRIKNNLANLHADWDPLQVTGTLAAPKITGQARVTPGGLLNLLGTIVRIDEATLSWSGDSPSSPRIAMNTTSSAEDPTIKNQWYNSSWYQAPVLGPGQGGTMDLTSQRASSAELMDSFAAGVMTYYQDRIAGAASGSVTQTELSYQPLPLFGETDTTARMTITQHLSPYATFIASTNPTDAEAQTYILDVHGFPTVPSLSAQVFTNDPKNTGATLQQTLRLGKGRDEDETGDRLHKVRIDAPKGISKRRVKKAISYRPNDPVPNGADMDVEIDAGDAMRRAGYPLAEVSVGVERHGKRSVDLRVTIVPGPKVGSEFTGDRPRKAARRAIAALYRMGEDEPASLEEIRRETVRALQQRGYLDPRVEVGVDHGDPAAPGAPSMLHVRALGGRKINPKAPQFLGVSPSEASSLAALFPTRFTRISLAFGAPAADQRVTRALGAIGYPGARVASRDISANGKDLAVLVEPGERQRFASVTITGVTPEVEARLAGTLKAHEGDPVDASVIAQSILGIEKDLRGSGHAQVDVKARLDRVSEERPSELALTFDVTPGPTYKIDDVTFRGAKVSKTGWLDHVAGLDTGKPVDPQEISKARARLGRSGVFQEIRVTTDPPTEMSAREATTPSAETDHPIPTKVLFDLTEKKRWQLAYGGRYESNVGFGVVADLYNFNSLGRGHTTALRGIYAANEQRIQLYHSIPRIFGERSSVEGLVEWSNELEDDVWTKGEHAWVQVTLPLSRRWQNRVYAEFERVHKTEETVDPNTPLDQRVISPRLGWQLIYDSRDLHVGGGNRAKGLFYGLNLIGSSGALGSNLTSLGTFQQLSQFLPFGDPASGRIDWQHSYRVSTANVRDESVPTDNRLKAGGEFSVRGYPTNSLGPHDDTGAALGGEFLLIANEELHIRLGAGFSTLVFCDAGNVWATLHDVSWQFATSCGVGFRWFSPFGPLRLDWAFPLNRRPDDPRSTLYFGFGSVF